ncbi:hypothetical protein PIB30_091472 [Stylosanthes scabra]|uniref:Uncharacterized protein n=1 Tax=Stylosanthes scabra TaxID=79078 RepID=A0ABU6WSZ1_9FABA|nr:hypothetical protein [Stylosanthes scabra]
MDLVALSNSTVLAKSLVDIAATLKEIKEGQQVTPILLKRQPDNSQQKPVKHCGICSCNSHHTDEYPQLQENNTIASTHNFYDATTIQPYNKKYYTQGGRDGPPACWIPQQQPQTQPRQPYTYNFDDEDDEESENESEEDDKDESAEEDSEDESAEEEYQTEEEESEDEEDVYNKRTSFIATLFNNKEIKEEVSVKCKDPGPCLVTCKIKGVEVRECLCDLGACSSVSSTSF